MTNYFKNLLTLYRFIPTALTLGNVICGFTAILNILLIYRPIEGQPPDVSAVLIRSAWLIAASQLFDMLDGWTARKLKAESAHGMQMDSLADMVTFGVAPAVMVAALAHSMSERYIGRSFWWVWLLCGVYVSCVALRLALYNVIAMDEGCSDTFNGLPSPGGAAAVASMIFVYHVCSKDPELKGILRNVDIIAPAVIAEYVLNVLPVYAGILGLLMVSKIPYMHFGKWLGSRKHNKLKILMIILFAFVFLQHPLIVATCAINAYVLWAPVKYFLGFARRRATKHPDPQMNGG